MSGLRNLARHVFHRAGALKFVRHQTRHLLKVLMYHHFPPGQEDDFDQQCIHIERYYHPIAIDDLLAWMTGGPALPKNPIMVTIDDGYKDFYTVALGILSRHKIPSLMFPVTDFIDGDSWLWFDRVVHAFRHTRLPRFRPPLEHKPELLLETPEQRAGSQTWMLAALMRAPEEERVAIVEKIATLLDIDIPVKPPAEYAPMSWDEIIDAASRGVTFGGHTCSHPVMSRVRSPESLRKEVSESKRRLESQLHRPIKAFAYPFGGPEEINEAAKQAVRDAGFEVAFTSMPGFVDQPGERWRFCRIGAGLDHPSLYFRQQIAGFRVSRA